MATSKKDDKSTGKTTDPKEHFWNAGSVFYDALVKAQKEACKAAEEVTRDQQEKLWKVQSQARKRANDVQDEYFNALNKSRDSEDSQVLGVKAHQKYQEALSDIQEKIQKETGDLAESRQKALQNLQECYQQNCYAAYVGYVNECQKIWGQIDADNLSCESLAFIGQSLAIGAQLVGGRA